MLVAKHQAIPTLSQLKSQIGTLQILLRQFTSELKVSHHHWGKTEVPAVNKEVEMGGKQPLSFKTSQLYSFA